MRSERDALEVEVADRRLVLPLDEVHKVVEVDVDAPPPLSSSWVSGLGVLGGRIVLSVSVVAQARRKDRRTIKGIELSGTGGNLAWVIEVDRIVGSVRAEAAAAQVPGERWLLGGEAGPAWIDVSRLRAELMGSL